MGDPAKVGMMEGAFFVPRTELIQWVNRTLELSITKVEQCATGCVYAQIVDSCYPGKVQMHKLKWNAKSEYEYINNFKVLQAALTGLGCDRNVEVQKLVRAKFQDNMEMLQWMRAFHDKVGAPPDYNPVQRRGKLPTQGTPEWVPHAGRVGSAGAPAKENVPLRERPAKEPAKEPARRPAPAGRAAPAGESAKLKEELQELRVTAHGLERERDFYFGKLRDIEIMCQNHEADSQSNLTLDGFMKEVMKIMYATDDDLED